MRSTPELLELITHFTAVSSTLMERVAGIEPASSAWKAEVIAIIPYPLEIGGGRWIRTTEAYASDLQSDPFGHSGTPPHSSVKANGAGTRSRTPDLLITSQLLYRLSYTG